LASGKRSQGTDIGALADPFEETSSIQPFSYSAAVHAGAQYESPPARVHFCRLGDNAQGCLVEVR
jgi:hypothetical protein